MKPDGVSWTSDWWLTFGTAPWFASCSRCDRYLGWPVPELVGARVNEPTVWFCMACVAELVNADDLEAIDRMARPKVEHQ